MNKTYKTIFLIAAIVVLLSSVFLLSSKKVGFAFINNEKKCSAYNSTLNYYEERYNFYCIEEYDSLKCSQYSLKYNQYLKSYTEECQ